MSDPYTNQLRAEPGQDMHHTVIYRWRELYFDRVPPIIRPEN